MASVEMAVDDCSPAIFYAPDGAWIDTPPGDPLISSYLANSLHTTSVSGATATVLFNGTGISVYGGYRPNYGLYTFTVDGRVVTGNAFSATPSKQVLGSISGLSNGFHTAVLTNTGSNTSIDIDWFQLQTHMGQQSVEITNTTVDDTSPLVSYGPSSSDWTVASDTISINDTSHSTSNPGAFASFQFKGGAVAIYGTVSPNHSDIQVSLDGEITTFTGGGGGFVQGLHSQTLLYYRSNIGNQVEHNIVLSAAPQQNSGYIDLDAFMVFSASNGDSPPGAPGTNTTIIPHSGGSGNSNANGSLFPQTVVFAIAVTVSVVVILGLVILGLYLQHRRRRGKRHELVVTSPRSPRTPDLPIQRPRLMEDGFNFTPAFEGSRRDSVQSANSVTPMLAVNTVTLQAPKLPTGRV